MLLATALMLIDEANAEGAHTDLDAAAQFLDEALTRQLAEAVSFSQDERDEAAATQN